MYNSLNLRRREIYQNIQQLLDDMAIDRHQFFHAEDAYADAPPPSSSRSSPAPSTAALRARPPVSPTKMSSEGTPAGNVKVVVRVRTFLPREIERGAECLVQMIPGTEETKLLAPTSTDAANSRATTRRITEEKTFIYDKSFWSHKPDDAHYAQQEDVYNALGEEMLDHNFEGYHTCVFAYGQTGSGKSYTMMGTPEQPGLIPRTCQDLFERIESSESPNVSYNVRVSYFEVYNEHVRDLLVARTDVPNYLKVRESPTEGPYVKDLSEHPVRNYQDIIRLMNQGDSSRTVASTKMNDTSSRSHAVFTIMLKQIHADTTTDETTERTARIRLVDLAGSERAKSTEATGARLREGSNINKSLTTLGRVIAALSSPSNAPSTSSRQSIAPSRASIAPRTSTAGGSRPSIPREIVPYRDSVLTYLLTDSLGGNSKTAMIACISPSDYDETLSTLRYADQARRIRTRATINQDSLTSVQRDAQIAALQQQITNLQQQISASTTMAKEGNKMKEVAARMEETQLEEYQKQVERMQRLMEETRLVSECRIRALAEENEALKVHLKLAVESLRAPIVLPKRFSQGSRRGTSMMSVNEDTSRDVESEEEEEEESLEPVDEDDGYISANSADLDDQDDQDLEEMQDVQMQMQELLNDLGLFRRKLGDDRGRFVGHCENGSA
jgi:hypothetical protein